jgi:hypothetical protein
MMIPAGVAGGMFEFLGKKNFAEVIGTESIDVFFRVDRTDDFGNVGLEMLGEGELDDEARDVGVGV